MTFQDTVRLIKQTGPVHAALSWWYTNLKTRSSILQGIAVIVVGILLGTVPLISSRFNPLLAGLFVIAAVLPFGLLLIGAAGYQRKVLLATILIEIPIQIDYRIGYSENEQRLGTVSGFTVSVTTIILVIFYAWWLAALLSKWIPPSSRTSVRMILPSIIYVVIVVLSVLVAREVIAAVNWIGVVLQAFLLYVFIIHTIRTRQDMYFVVTVLLFSLLFSSIVIIGFGLTGAGPEPSTAALVQGVGDGPGRVGGPLKVANLTGSYLAMAVSFTFSLFSIPQKWWYKLLVAFAIGLGGFALFWTGSRGSWISFGGSVILLGFLVWRQGWLSLKIPMAYLVVVVIIALIFHEPLLSRLFGEAADEAAASRVPMDQLAFRMIRDNFLIGVGANNFAAVGREYVTSEFTGEWLRVVHNQYLLVWVENGIVGLGAYMWFLLTTLSRGWQVWRQHDRFLSPLALGFSAALLAAMVHMLAEKYHARVQVEMVWLMAGLITATYRIYMADDNVIPQGGSPVPSHVWL